MKGKTRPQPNYSNQKGTIALRYEFFSCSLKPSYTIKIKSTLHLHILILALAYYHNVGKLILLIEIIYSHLKEKTEKRLGISINIIAYTSNCGTSRVYQKHGIVLMRETSCRMSNDHYFSKIQILLLSIKFLSTDAILSQSS